MALEEVKDASTASPSASSPPSKAQIRPVAGPATVRPRHRRILMSFATIVLLPLVACAVYLWEFAQDQYISTTSFSVRAEGMQSALDLLGGGVSAMMGGGGSTNDPEIIKQFIESPDLVRRIEEREAVSDVFSLGWPRDFIFAYDPDGKLEDLHAYWKRNVFITIENGLITVDVRSYDAARSKEIAYAIFEESRDLVNYLSQEARDDATRFSREELAKAEKRLKAAREAMTQFRLESKIVDPMATLQAEIGILSSLQAQLAEALVQQELLSKTSQERDPRLTDISRKIAALRTQIDLERNKFAQDVGQRQGQDYATLFSQFERILAEREFAEESYRASAIAYDSALAEAKMNSRYLAMHIRPNQAEKSLYPDRIVQFLVAGLFLFLLWSIGLLFYYSVRDRR